MKKSFKYFFILTCILFIMISIVAVIFMTGVNDLRSDSFCEETLEGVEHEPQFMNYIFRITIALSRYIFVLIGIIILLVLFYKYIKAIIVYIKFKKNNKDKVGNDNIESKLKELAKAVRSAKFNLGIGIVISAVLFFIAFILFLVTTFSSKPIIYIYPPEEQVVTVELENEDLITCSYPKYEGKWSVLAKPNGDLTDLETGRKLYALYWEGGDFNKPNYKEGFIVKGEDSAKFLEEKLEILGLNEKESEEFIVYWLPKMEKNNYNYIRFVSQEEIDNQMPLIINPKPDTVIRIYMQFKGLPFPINVKEQQLDKVERNGFTVVEWGGSEL